MTKYQLLTHLVASFWHVCSQCVITSLLETILQLLNSLKGYKKGQFWPDLVNTCCAKFPNIPYGYLRLNLKKITTFLSGLRSRGDSTVRTHCGGFSLQTWTGATAHIQLTRGPRLCSRKPSITHTSLLFLCDKEQLLCQVSWKHNG